MHTMDRIAEASKSDESVKQEDATDNLKERINNLLWTTLPDTVTLQKAEQIAITIHSLILKEWER